MLRHLSSIKPISGVMVTLDKDFIFILVSTLEFNVMFEFEVTTSRYSPLVV